MKFFRFIFFVLILSPICLLGQKLNNENYKKMVSFSGFNFLVKSSKTVKVGPGNNYFADSNQNVQIDENGKLHLRITKVNNKWFCAEIASTTCNGYGTYRIYLDSRIDSLDENIVFGIFLYDQKPILHHREIDIEFSKWAGETKSNSQYAVFPTDGKIVKNRFNTVLSGNYSTHFLTYTKDSISFSSYHGHVEFPGYPAKQIAYWSYKTDLIPPSSDERLRFNLWLYKGKKPKSLKQSEVIISEIKFTKNE